MINITNNPFTNSSYQMGRSIADDVALRNYQLKPPASLVASWNNQDDYVPSPPSSAFAFDSSSGTYKRSTISSVAVASEETAQSEKITDRMREEMTCDDGSHWTARGLTSFAYPTLFGIIDQVFEEKGIDETVFYEGCSFNYSINPDGVFIFHPEELNVKGVDLEFAQEICLALEEAVNSSVLNMEDNPQLFTKEWIPPDYDPSRWGRDLDREEWINDRSPDFSEFTEQLRSDILKTFGEWNIVDFSMKIDDQGKLTIFNVQTKENDPKSNARTTEHLNSGLTAEINEKAEYLGLLLFSDHMSQKGDVLLEGMLAPFDDGGKGLIKPYKHEVILASGTDYRVVRAPEQQNDRAVI